MLRGHCILGFKKQKAKKKINLKCQRVLYFSSPIFPHANILESNNDMVQQICRKSLSGQSTPSGMQTPHRSSAEPSSQLQQQRTERTSSASTSRGTTPIDKKAPFRL